jgi:hypothetical protein
MKITSGTVADAPPLTPFEHATSLKSSAVDLYKHGKYLAAGEMFVQASSTVLVGHPNDLAQASKDLACACFSNASNAFLKGGEGERAKKTAERCLEWAQDEGMEVKGR